ncbi:unnamed protein product [Pieris macdunnoughi]|uniref:Uncharacterized protein n=1 Tax=Pieris macdunnoughi TaxID=345717 RepID=A0A821UXQ4_9NEOP|nr:unnamed protein product [Pieris macdunnoughi]
MKGGLCIIYTSLLTISVLSSCALFLLVVSEALQIENVDQKVDLSGLHNVSKKTNVIASSESDQSSDTTQNLHEPENQGTGEDDKKMIFPDTVSVNSVTTDGRVVTIEFFVSTKHVNHRP